MKTLHKAIIVAALSLAAPAASLAYGEYTVRKGDNLYRISRTYRTTVDDLKALNSLASDALKPGMRLRVPGSTGPQAYAAPPAPAPSRPARAGEAGAPPAVFADVRPDAPRVSLAPPDAPSCREQVDYHVIRKGETLSAISRRYRVPVAELISLNRIRNTRGLQIGQHIAYSRRGPREYTVGRGDTLLKISEELRIDPARIMSLNDLEGDVLAPGRKLLLEACRDDYATEAAEVEYEPTPLDAAVAWSAADEYPPAGDFLAFLELTGEDEPGAALPEEVAAGPLARRLPLSDSLISFAKNMLNIPYRFGGSTLRGMDCSAYVQKVFSFLDVELPRTAREQFKLGETVSRDGLAKGDLVFFRTYARYASHVGIYLGDNRFIHASSRSRKVTIDSFDQPYYRQRFLGARRLYLDSFAQSSL